MNIEHHEVKSLEDYSAAVFGLAENTEDSVWFRGQSRSDRCLSPSLLRNKAITDTSLLKSEEEFFLHKFDQRGRPYVLDRNIDDFEKLFMMQHYGFPTRLLDWSENPYIGLYFALGNQDHDGAVYFLKPSFWNECSLAGRQRNTRRILNTDDEFAISLRPDKIKTGHQHTVSIFATHNTTRIIAQRGVFTIFGASLESMDTQYNGFPENEEPKILSDLTR